MPKNDINRSGIGLVVPFKFRPLKNPVIGRMEFKCLLYLFRFFRSPMNDSSRMMSGIGALNMTAEVDSSNFMPRTEPQGPPPAPQLGRKKRLPPMNNHASFLNVTGKMGGGMPPVLNLNKFLGLECSGGSVGPSDGSFGVLPHGTLSW